MLINVAAGLIFFIVQLARPGSKEVAMCVGATCSSRGALWQRVIDEREATRAGLMLSAHLGAMCGDELHTFDALIDSEWKAMPEMVDCRGSRRHRRGAGVGKPRARPTLRWRGAGVGRGRSDWASWPADHFLVLTHAKEWTQRFLAWRG